MSTQERQREKNASSFPIIGVPERACATLTELVLQAAADPWAAREMQFYGINRLIRQCKIPNGSFLDIFFHLQSICCKMLSMVGICLGAPFVRF